MDATAAFIQIDAITIRLALESAGIRANWSAIRFAYPSPVIIHVLLFGERNDQRLAAQPALTARNIRGQPAINEGARHQCRERRSHQVMMVALSTHSSTITTTSTNRPIPRMSHPSLIGRLHVSSITPGARQLVAQLVLGLLPPAHPTHQRRPLVDHQGE